MPLTKLGAKTRDGFRQQYGDDGDIKFRQAMQRGLIDAAKMTAPHKTQKAIASKANARTPIEATNNQGVRRSAPPRPQVVVPAPPNPASSQPRAAPGTFRP